MQSAKARTSLTTIKRIQRSAEVREQLEQAILRGDFSPGERLPSERELVETFGVSRVSVREAIRSLEAVGRVKVEQGRGAFVSDRRSGFGEPMTRWLALHQDEVVELQSVRGALDALAAASAAVVARKKQQAAIVRTHAAFESAVERDSPTEQLVDLDIDFHIAVAEASGNRLLYDLLSDLHNYLAQSRYLVLALSGRRLQSVAEHARIVEAIEARDADASRSAANAHVASVREFLQSGSEEQAAATV